MTFPIIKSFSFSDLRMNRDPQLRRNGVYALALKGRFYIGSTSDKNGFVMRFRQHASCLRTNRHHNPHLQSIANKYGLATLTFHLLELTEKQDVRLREMDWLMKYQNNADCVNVAQVANEAWLGRQLTSATKEKLSKSKGTPFSLEHEGVLYTGVNLKKFCVGRGLDQATLYLVRAGKRKQYKGWTLPGRAIAPHIVVSPDGTEFVIPYYGLRAFAKTHNLEVSAICQLVKGCRPLHKGWRKKGTLVSEELIKRSATCTREERALDNLKGKSVKQQISESAEIAADRAAAP